MRAVGGEPDRAGQSGEPLVLGEVRVEQRPQIPPLQPPQSLRGGGEQVVGGREVAVPPPLIGERDRPGVQGGLGAGVGLGQLLALPLDLPPRVALAVGAARCVGLAGDRLLLAGDRPAFVVDRPPLVVDGQGGQLPLLDRRERAADRQCRGQQQHRSRERRIGRMPLHPSPRAFGRRDRAGPDRLAPQIPPQLLGQLGGRGVPLLRRLLQALPADRLQILRQRRVQRPHAGRLLLDDLPNRVDRGRPGMRRAAAEHRVEHRAERVDVRRRADRRQIALRLLRRHVGRRAEHLAGGREVALPAAGLADLLGQPEVGHMRAAFGVEQDVGRLEVAMHHVAGVGVADRVGDGGRELGGLVGRERPLADEIGQALALDQAHREVRPRLMLADLVDRHDPGMVELGGGLGLGAEPANLLSAGELAGEDHLQRDQPAERRLPRPIHHAHAAARDLGEDLVVADVTDPLAGRGTAGRRITAARRRLAR